MKRAGFMVQYEVMQGHLVEAGCAVFAGLGATVAEVHDGASLDLSVDVVVSSLGYASDRCRGAIVLVSTPAMLRTLDVGVPAPTTDADLGDLQGEVANMVLGRLKSGVRKHGVQLSVSTPTSFVGRDLSVPTPRGGTSSWHRFSSRHGSVYVRFDVIFEPTFALDSEASVAREGDAVEGDILVF